MFRPRLRFGEQFTPFHRALLVTGALLLVMTLLWSSTDQTRAYRKFELFVDCMATRHRPDDTAWDMNRNQVICYAVMNR